VQVQTVAAVALRFGIDLLSSHRWSSHRASQRGLSNG
jgi:hypothetical protein